MWAKGGEGGVALANEVLRLIDESEKSGARFDFVYTDEMSLKEKIEAIATKVYGADGVDFAPASVKEMERLAKLGFSNLPVCMAKTQSSLSDDPTKIGRPTGWRLTVRSMKVSAGAGFVVVLCGEIMTMPGLPKVPAAEKIDIDVSGKISGLF